MGVDLATYIRIGVAILLCAMAAWTDFRTWRIPNPLTFTGLFLGLAIGLVSSGPKGILAAGVGALVTVLVPLILFRMGAMGGGDVKLFAALGALLGTGMGLETQMAAFMFGAAQGIIIWIKRGQLRAGFTKTLALIIPPVFKKHKHRGNSMAITNTEIRFGPAVLAGVVVACSARFIG